MHGRLKVKTTEEQDEQKRKEREQKLKMFRRGCKVAFEKVSNEVFDEGGFDATQQLLTANSDISTLWNYRKNALLYFKENKTTEEVENMYKEELVFIVGCLRKNPKSYGCWNHRCFCMLNMPNADWKYELELCDLFLELDDRNFHCWDYRRFVVKNSTAKIPIENELKTTVKLIETNFSNYSSWHYRSKLLPLVFPDEKDASRIAEKKLLEELELVQNAFFTDPEDQSAWFYHRWLLGRGKEEQRIMLLHYDVETNILALTFCEPVNEMFCRRLSVLVDGKQKDVVWVPSIPHTKYQHVWFCEGLTWNEEMNLIQVKNEDGNIFKETSTTKQTASVAMVTFHHRLSAAKVSVLQSELESCQELDELEPGNKWAILTLVLLMRAVNPKAHEEDIQRYMGDLQRIDVKREVYYKDLMSKYMIEDALTHAADNPINLSGMNLTRLCHLKYFSGITKLNVSNNSLKKLPIEIKYLWLCEEIDGSNNQISDITAVVGMKKLKTLRVDNNQLTFASVTSAFQLCKGLVKITLTGNEIKEEEIVKLSSCLHHLKISS